MKPWFLRRRHLRRARVESSEYELQAAPAFLFQRRRLNHRPEEQVDTHGPRAILSVGNQPPHHVTRRDEPIVIRRGEASTLTITSDPGNAIVVVGGSAQDRSVFFSADGFGQTAAEAEQTARLRSLEVGDTNIAIHAPDLYDRRHDESGALVVEAPSDSGVVIHSSFASAEVRDLNGPVRIAATHARATVLGTTGRVDVTAGCVDFAGDRGHVTLTSESEINLKVSTRRFDGTLLAWAQRSVRLLIPPAFRTPLEVSVSARDRFVCRADVCPKMVYHRQGELHVFTYNWDLGDSTKSWLRLRSEQSTVVIDPANADG